MAFTDVWDIAQPPDTQQANLLGQDIRSLKLDIQQRMGAISGLLGNRPDYNTDAQPNNWLGWLYITTDTFQVFRWQGTSWADVSAIFQGIARTGITFFKTSGVVAGINGTLSNSTQNLVTTPPIPGGTLGIGSVIEITVWGRFSTSGGVNYSLGAYYGGQQIGYLQYLAPPSNKGFYAIYRMKVTNLPATEAGISVPVYPTSIASIIQQSSSDIYSLTVDTTGSQVVTLQSTIPPSSSIFVDDMTVAIY